ncbi:hypothetical protein [Proteiniphilum propionicum]|jgi:hypothetical protein|uniref:hypothetical protein n=1 Tax=Proteiniphilum propionicum TaxID=2829812 RepID=UPI001EEAEF1B|nr:hypothetical protein [Proteiniphilum propionicum]ULB35940.1 hypothetical protein KDN43_07995 [Proteiniphilum propionicum]
MKKDQSVQSMNNALGALPTGARIQSAKGYYNRSGRSRMDMSYSVGSAYFKTTITTPGGQRA